MTHDYKRHGTTTLFAALNTLDGSVISRCESRHRHVEWLKFLKQIDRETPGHQDLHVICDNYATHKHAKVKDWLEKHPRFHMHFTPTYSSWLNLVERWFAELTNKALRRAAHRSVKRLLDAIKLYIEQAKSTTPATLIQIAAEVMIGVSRMQPSGQVIAA